MFTFRGGRNQLGGKRWITSLHAVELVNYTTRSCNFFTLVDATERDPAPLFFDEEVQACLKTLTTLNYKKIFRTRMDGHRNEPPQYKFLTDEQLREAREAARKKAEEYLEMPPVVKRREEKATVLDRDVALLNHDTAKYVFTDITYGLKDHDRIITIREPDGTLRYANWQERDRLVQTYFPKLGRNIDKPKMFQEEYLIVSTPKIHVASR